MSMLELPDLAPDAIRAAHAAIHPAFTNSPQFVHDGLSARLGAPVIVKVETVNPIRSFKGRGTWVVISALARDGVIGPDRPVVCASAGNFGQGIAFAAGPAGVRSVVFASRNAGRLPKRASLFLIPDLSVSISRPVRSSWLALKSSSRPPNTHFFACSCKTREKL